MNLTKTINDIEYELKNKNHKLIIIIGDSNSNHLLSEKLQNFKNIDSLNLNFYLSKILHSLSKNERTDPVNIIEDIISEHSSKDVILFCNINILFDTNLKWNPIEIFKKLSRNHFLIVLWDGKLTGNKLQYASSQHLEYCQYQLPDLGEIFIIEQ